MCAYIRARSVDYRIFYKSYSWCRIVDSQYEFYDVPLDVWQHQSVCEKQPVVF